MVRRQSLELKALGFENIFFTPPDIDFINKINWNINSIVGTSLPEVYTNSLSLSQVINILHVP